MFLCFSMLQPWFPEGGKQQTLPAFLLKPASLKGSFFRQTAHLRRHGAPTPAWQNVPNR